MMVQYSNDYFVAQAAADAGVDYIVYGQNGPVEYEAPRLAELRRAIPNVLLCSGLNMASAMVSDEAMTFCAEAGEIYVLMGENGAGKRRAGGFQRGAPETAGNGARHWSVCAGNAACGSGWNPHDVDEQLYMQPMMNAWTFVADFTSKAVAD